MNPTPLRGTSESADERHPSLIPGALEHALTRELPNGALIEFEQAPRGWLTAKGEVRFKDHRAYYWSADCRDCDTGRVPGKRDGTTKMCPTCRGTGRKRVRLPSVTTVLDSILPKPGLTMWSEARGIEGGVLAVKRGLIDLDDEASIARAVEIVRSSAIGADRARDEAADRGLNVHDCLEHYMRTGSPPNPAQHPPMHWGYLQALTRWLLMRDPEPRAVEQLVAHPEDGYAGRLDLRAECDGALWTWDAKSQENGGIYLAAHVQVNLYERAEVRLGGTPAERLGIVVFAANGEFREMPADHPQSVVDDALAWYRSIKPIDSMCASANRAEREARRAAA